MFYWKRRGSVLEVLSVSTLDIPELEVGFCLNVKNQVVAVVNMDGDFDSLGCACKIDSLARLL